MNRTLLTLIFAIFLFSCSKEKNNDCNYSLTDIPQDTTLYISYDINGEHFKFYQQRISGHTVFQPVEVNSSNEMRYYQRSIAFDRLITDDEYTIQLHPATYIVFWNYMIDNKQSEEDFFNYYLFESCLSKELRSTYKYTSPSISYDNNIALKDTVFLKGVELSWYTSEVFEHFNYDTASINNFFNNEVYFTINDVINVCNDYSKVSGTFSTKSINRGEIFSIENGKFTFITK